VCNFGVFWTEQRLLQLQGPKIQPFRPYSLSLRVVSDSTLV
jgi:hypothetical protein